MNLTNLWGRAIKRSVFDRSVDGVLGAMRQAVRPFGQPRSRCALGRHGRAVALAALAVLALAAAENAAAQSVTTLVSNVGQGQTVDSANAYTMTIDVTDDERLACGVPDIEGDDRHEILSGTMTVEILGALATYYGFDSRAGSLSDRTFSIDSTDHTIDLILVKASGTPKGNLIINLDSGHALTATERAALRLHVCGTDYDFSAAIRGPATYSWAGSLDWSPPVVTRTVYLSLPGPNPNPNAEPTAADNTVTTGVDTAYTFTADDFGFADTDLGDTLARVRILTLPAPGTLALAGWAVVADQVVTRARIDAGDLTFTPVTGASGVGYASFTFKVDDGKADSDSAYTMTIDAPVTNTAPTAANNTVTTRVDTAYTFEADDFGFTDTNGDTLASVKIVTLPALGTLALDGTAVTVDVDVAKTDIDADKLIFTPVVGASGTGYASFTFKVNDGTVDSDSAYTMTIDVEVAPVTNTAPTAANNTVTTRVDTAYTFEADDFRFDDMDTGDTLASVKIVTLPALGTLALDGAAVSLNGGVTKADIDGNMLTFTPVTGASGTGYATFTFKVNDGTVDSDSAYTMTIDVTAPTTSSDATLSAIALQDASDDSAITISPTFTAETTSYTASVDNDVDEITIAPTVNESNATIEYLDSTDTEITDADGEKTGQQVSLVVGPNTLKVQVTAEDGTTPRTYTVTVTRDRATGIGPGITTGRRSPPSPPPPGDVVGYLENPGAASFQSGIGVISGWVCDAEEVEITLNGEPQEAAYGTARLDTEAMCGDSDNGFGLLFNWNLLGDGEHEVVALVDGVELDRATVTVTTLGTEFLRDVTGTCTAADFPTGDETVTLAWQQTQQNFVLVDGPAPTGANRAGTPGVGYLENPGPHSFQSGIGVLSGWACEGEEVVIELNGQPQPAAYGTERLDTLEMCGDTANGFGLLFNWNLLGEGEHEVVAFVDGEELGRATVRVTTLGAEFVRDVEGECVVEDFPMLGETVTLEWQQNSQNFVIMDME